jgi:hypothetical protein
MARAGNLVGGKYRLFDLIGEGSMGAVWKAVHETLDRPFAVKFLKDYEDNAARLEDRFLVEARLSAAVRHPNIVDVLDYGRTDEGTPYIVMEYLDGVSLGTRLRQLPGLPVGDLLRIVQQALHGLAAVHEAGILHRDLKPDNIVLYPERNRLVAKLVDFGISRQVRSRPDERLTSPGTTVGTPWYMAPELVQARPTVDLRSDLYSMGVILYEALTGSVPYQHDELQMVLLKVSAGGATPLAQLRPDLPGALCQMIDRSMALDPEKRFATAADFASALHAVARLVPAAATCRLRDDHCHVSALPRPRAPSPVPPAQAAVAAAAVAPAPAPAPDLVAPVDATPTQPVRRWHRRGRTSPPPLFVAAGVVVFFATVALVGKARHTQDGIAAARAPSGQTAPSAARANGAAPAPFVRVTPTPATTKPGPAMTTMMTTATTTPMTSDAVTTALPTADNNNRIRRSSATGHAGGRRPPEIFRNPGF